MKKYYAVQIGRIPGVYNTWEECENQVKGYSGAVYKSFTTETEAKKFVLNENNDTLDFDCPIAYVDGSFSLEKAMFSYGAVLLIDNKELTFSNSFLDPELVSMRNVAGEIKGSEFVMKYCIENKISEIAIYYDYEGIEKWCTGVWKTNKIGTKRYKDYYDSIKNNLIVHFIKVKGHSGVKYNEMADKLAKEALGII